jgi:hypothetical protein
VRPEFCTLFDAGYLPRALALYRSLSLHCAEFRLHALCMDAESERLLQELRLPHVRTVQARELESFDPALLEVRPTRTDVEYCWTAKASACLYVLGTGAAPEAITYVDSDLGFFGDPRPLFDEMGESSVMIVPHRFASAHRAAEATSGPYNAGWVTFRNDGRALAVLEWWRERCLEWCYFRFEDGKMSDQKYLDDWPERFEGVHMLEHPGGGLAPWNVAQYRLGERDGHVTVDGRELVFYHYHSLRLFRPTLLARATSALRDLPRGGTPLLWSTSYPVSEVERRLIWEPYLRSLHLEWTLVRTIEPSLSAGVGSWRLRDEITMQQVRAFAALRARRLRDWPHRLRTTADASTSGDRAR